MLMAGQNRMWVVPMRCALQGHFHCLQSNVHHGDHQENCKGVCLIAGLTVTCGRAWFAKGVDLCPGLLRSCPGKRSSLNRAMGEQGRSR